MRFIRFLLVLCLFLCVFTVSVRAGDVQDIVSDNGLLLDDTGTDSVSVNELGLMTESVSEDNGLIFMDDVRSVEPVVIDGPVTDSAGDYTVPSRTSIIKVDVLSVFSVRIKFEESTGADGYSIERSCPGVSGYALIKSTKKLSFTDKTVVPGMDYRYRVRPFRKINNKRVYGAYSKAVFASTKLGKIAKRILKGMTLRQKVAQMFFVVPESLGGSAYRTKVNSKGFKKYPVGGLILMNENIVLKNQVKIMLKSYQELSDNIIGLPVFTGIDEEGGSVTRIAGRNIIKTPIYSSMLSIGNTGDASRAYAVGRNIGTYIKKLGFNLDFAPVADVWTNSKNTVIGSRAFGSDANLVANMVSSEIKGFHGKGVLATVKHFPGHGNTRADSHSGMAVTKKSLKQLNRCELLPFKSGIDAGADFVMMGHISCPKILPDDTPASLSRYMCTDLLRNKLGFDGIIITDGMNMGAIVNRYGTGDAAVRAVKAGNDMLLMPGDFKVAYRAVINAVKSGEIAKSRINESVLRIITKKLELKYGLVRE